MSRLSLVADPCLPDPCAQNEICEQVNVTGHVCRNIDNSTQNCLSSKYFVYLLISPRPTGETGGDFRFSLRQSVRPSVSLSVSQSVCYTRFPDFSWLCFHISE